MVSGLFSRLIFKETSLLQPVNSMKTVNDTDLKRLEDLIINGQKTIETRFTAIESSIIEIKADIGEIKADIGEIKADIKEIKQDVKSLEIGQAKLTERIEGMDTRLKTVEGSQKNQIWALITILGGSLSAISHQLSAISY
jgi:chromosome segregation ATPase